MKQLFQDIRTGAVAATEVPVPSCGPGQVLIRSACSLVSPGTERALLEFGRAGYLDKIRQRPDKARLVVEKARTDGVLSAIEAAKSKLAEPLGMGYSNVGVVVDVGDGVDDLIIGDRVVSNGPHAEFVCAPRNLCAKIPASVTDEEAAFTILGAIALQGVRLAQPSLGETFVVSGLGLIGLLTVQILVANGCKVLGLDPDPSKRALAGSFGAEVTPRAGSVDPMVACREMTEGAGVDGVIIAAATESDEVVHQAAEMCRKRGRIVLVGVVGLNLRRDDFYEKELTFQVSCSYGPGRYDPAYEDQGSDYPIGFVRWTENRNFQAILSLLDAGRLNVASLLTAKYPIGDADRFYARLLKDPDVLGVLLEYPRSEDGPAEPARTVRLKEAAVGSDLRRPLVVGAIGSGNYAGRVLLPAFGAAGVRLKTIISSYGRSSAHIGKRLGFEINSTDSNVVWEDPEISVVVVATRHDSHADLAVGALNSGKHVFVEKPLAMSAEDLDRVEEARRAALARGRGGRVMIGFNRRFAPLMVRLKTALNASREPFGLVYVCNAGRVPKGSWIHDPDVGGGRILGEACHFIDVARFLAGSPITESSIHPLSDRTALAESASIQLRFESGSVATVHYFANGTKSVPKERLQVFQGGRIHLLENFRVLRPFGGGAGRTVRTLRQDKGQRACVRAFIESLRDGTPEAVPFDELLEVSRVTLRLAEAVRPPA